MVRSRMFMAVIILLCVIVAQGQRLTQYTHYVNPFIGTAGHGHTYPGATYPFGMIQVSPDTRLEGWDGCSAYHASDDIIYGFSHTHLSGTGCSDYGDILLMPVTGDISLKEYDWASPFHQSTEKASPGYYQVGLDKYGIGVELSATKRTGFHRYTFSASDQPGVVLDLQHRDKVIESGLTITGDDEVEGFRFSNAWAKEQRIFFVIKFSKPFSTVLLESNGEEIEGGKEAVGENIKALFRFFPFAESERMSVKIGISGVSIEGARKNLEMEIPDWNFNRVKDRAQAAWAKELSKISVMGGSYKQRMVFYTALYHTMLSPNLYMDVGGRYRGRDMEIHQANGFDYYTVFSLWDTYRALHPLLALIDQKRTNDFINTFIRQYEEGGLLPVWELSANETFCMIGYHSIPVIADAYLKGIRGYDAVKAFEAMKNSAEQDHLGLKYYKSQGFIPGDKEGESVSKTLEYAYDDWCIAQMAKEMGNEDDYQNYIQRAQYYKNIFDPSTGFMRAKLNNQWFSPFDPYEVNFNYTEANAWQYNMYVPQDITGMVELHGGDSIFAATLDQLFSAESETTGRDQADITGLIGQYAHGNEPSHHMVYLYDYVGQPWKTQELVHQIMKDFYTTERDGLCGNEDCGQMSAWYVFSALGFYPVTPGSDIYAVGTPQFPFTKIKLENGKSFIIRANNISLNNFYVQSCSLNGDPLETPFISYQEIMNGGELVFDMGSQPKKNWGTYLTDSRSAILDKSKVIRDHLIQPVPFVQQGENTFFDSTTITLSSLDPDAKISYAISQQQYHFYTQPITIHETTTLTAFAQKEGGEPSFTIESTFQKIPENRKITLNTQYASQYAAGGDIALIDFQKGGENFKTGVWQGYEGVNLDAVIDLGEIQDINKISVGFLQDVNSWIFFPVEVEFYTSSDGENYTLAGVSIHEVSQKDYTIRTLEQWSDLDPSVSARYVKVVAKTAGICPEWHPGAGKKCWIFVDEIKVK